MGKAEYNEALGAGMVESDSDWGVMKFFCTRMANNRYVMKGRGKPKIGIHNELINSVQFGKTQTAL